MARRCCDRWTDGQCDICGGALASEQKGFHFVWGRINNDDEFSFGLGVMVTEDAFLFLLGPFHCGLAFL